MRENFFDHVAALDTAPPQKLYQELIIERAVPRLEAFGDIYSSAILLQAKQELAEALQLIEGRMSQSDKNRKAWAEIFETIVCLQIEQGDWLGNEIAATFTTPYDDIIGSLDGVIEGPIEHDSGERLRIGFDCTFSQEQLEKKLVRTKKRLDAGRLFNVKFFTSPHEGNNLSLTDLPGIILYAPKQAVAELAELWKKDKTQLRNHPLKFVILEQTLYQLFAAKAYLESPGCIIEKEKKKNLSIIFERNLEHLLNGAKDVAQTIDGTAFENLDKDQSLQLLRRNTLNIFNIHGPILPDNRAYALEVLLDRAGALPNTPEPAQEHADAVEPVVSATKEIPVENIEKKLPTLGALKDQLRTLGIKSRMDYIQNFRGQGWPSTPHITYRNEWTNWNDFLNTSYSRVQPLEAAANYKNTERVVNSAGLYRDVDGTEWYSTTYLKNYYSTTHGRSLLDRLKNVPRITGASGNIQIPLYRGPEALTQLADFELPRADSVTNIFTTPEGKHYAPRGYVEEKYVFKNSNQANTVFNSTARIDGRNRSGVRGFLYDLDSIEALKLPQRSPTEQFTTELPQVNPTTNIYTRADGKQFAPLSFLAQETGRTESDLKNTLNTIPLIVGKERTNKRCRLYDLQAARETLASANPEAKKPNGYFVDPNGKAWAPFGYFMELLSTTEGSIRGFLKTRKELPSIKGGKKGGHFVTLYGVDEVTAAFLDKKKSKE